MSDELDPDEVPTVAGPDGPLGSHVDTPEFIGPYRLLKPLGEGGMGQVFAAEQKEPIRRKVALKIIKPGMDTKEVLARFEAERQAVALMDHTNIARVYDAGTTGDGRPYFVMELVDGKPLTEFCDEKKLPLKERLELFRQVCHAVQHAHQKGIIHRDLKPSNILITTDSGKEDRPVPKIIDFGVAKALGPGLTEQTLYTMAGQIIGTPQYMSPEQAQFDASDIDTRSDIYSLGVLLYELLTGRTPVEMAELKKAGIDEMLRTIREEEAPKPSTKLHGLEENTQTSVAEVRQLPPSKLTQTLRGDLDWIVMKALEKERSRRYETANAFALDIKRYLGNEPVEASPPSASYQLRKFARRNRGLLVAGAAVVAVLVAGIITTAWQAREARVEQERAEAARADAEKLVGFMLVDLRSKLSSVGRLDLIRDVSTAVEEYFSNVSSQEEGETVSYLRSLMLLARAAVLEGEGNLEDSAKYAEEALIIAESLAELDPENEAYPDLLVDAYGMIDWLAYEESDFLRDADHVERMKEIADRLVAKSDPTVNDLQNAAFAYLRYATSQNGGIEYAEDALDFARRAEAIAPERSSPSYWQYQACDALSRTRSDPVSRLKAIEEGLVAIRRACELAPDHLPYLRHLGNALDQSSWKLVGMGKRNGDREMVERGYANGEEALAIKKKLLEISPDDQFLRRGYAHIHQNRGMNLLSEGELDKALRYYEIFIEEEEKVARRFPVSSSVLINFLHNAFVIASATHRKPEVADEWTAEFVRRVIDVFDLAPEKAQSSAMLHEKYVRLVSIAKQVGEHTEENQRSLNQRISDTLRVYETALEEESPMTSSAQSLHAHTHACLELASMARDEGNEEGAREWMARAEQRLISGIKNRPKGQDSTHIDDYVTPPIHQALGFLAQAYLELGEIEEFARLRELQIDWQLQLVASQGENASDALRGVALSYQKLGEQIHKRGDREKALGYYQEGAERSFSLFEADPSQVDSLLISTHHSLASAQKALQRNEEALATYERLFSVIETRSEEEIVGWKPDAKSRLAQAAQIWGELYEADSRWNEAEKAYRLSLKLWLMPEVKQWGVDGKLVATRAKARLASLYGKSGRGNSPERLQWYQEAYEMLHPLALKEELPSGLGWVYTTARNNLEKSDKLSGGGDE